MRKLKSFLRVFTDTGPLVALAVAIALLVGIVGPASAQFFNFGGPPQRQAPQRGGGWFGGDFFAPFQQQAPQQQAPRQDFSRAPGPAKRDTVAERNVLVLGDAMADWLGYGLEDAYSEQPDMGVIRKHKTVSGLIKYQPRGEPADWTAAAKAILATEKPDAIVVMLGLHDRVAIREAVTEKKPEKKDDKKDARGKTDAKPDAKPADGKPAEAKPADPKAKPEGATDTAKRDDKQVDAELSPDDAADDTPQVSAPEKSARSGGGLYEFRDERWVELYAKKIEELIGVLKSKGVPVLWVGLPAIRGQRGTSDMLYLDALYRDGAGKAGITYVDIWDGFVDEGGRFLQRGPDFEGQNRQLRSADGVFFTKAGARKLAHYVEREVTRLLAARSGPIAVPIEPVTPDANVVPGQPAPRPLAGPVMPLVASSVGTDQLLGGPGSRPASVDALAARTMVKGEALAAPAGRADDYAWPRREIGREQARGDTPVAATTPSSGTVATAPAPQRQLLLPPPQQTFQQPRRQPQQQQPPIQIRPAQNNTPSLRDFFGGFGAAPAPRPPGPPPAVAPRGPGNPGSPRPPGSVGRSAEGPPGYLSRF
jgi:hypothetical protein